MAPAFIAAIRVAAPQADLVQPEPQDAMLVR